MKKLKLKYFLNSILILMYVFLYMYLYIYVYVYIQLTCVPSEMSLQMRCFIVDFAAAGYVTTVHGTFLDVGGGGVGLETIGLGTIRTIALRSARVATAAAFLARCFGCFHFAAACARLFAMLVEVVAGRLA